jgi:type II secretory pathway pseudopilin PulG
MKPWSFEVNNKSGPRDKGYVLLVCLLLIAVLSVSFLTLIERVDFQFKRDREEELIHRGVQYSRAVRNFFNKFHRYPNSIEELENTNNFRFLRKRYKDPITGKDFKILHLTDMPNYISTQGLGVSVTSLAAQQQGFPALNGAAPATAGTSATGITGEGASGAADAESSSQNDQNSSNAPALLPSSSDSTEPKPADVTRAAGTLVVGVASASERKAIREFNRKDHYNQWLFIYDPSTDNRGILTTPSQPPSRVATQGSGSNSGQTNAPTATSLNQTQQ